MIIKFNDILDADKWEYDYLNHTYTFKWYYNLWFLMEMNTQPNGISKKSGALYLIYKPTEPLNSKYQKIYVSKGNIKEMLTSAYILYSKIMKGDIDDEFFKPRRTSTPD